MDKEHFDQLVKGVREMKRHMAGKAMRGAPPPMFAKRAMLIGAFENGRAVRRVVPGIQRPELHER